MSRQIKLYYHKTDGGAEYLMDNFITCPSGKREGTFENSKYIVRIDNNINKDVEMFVEENNADLLELCKKLLNALENSIDYQNIDDVPEHIKLLVIESRNIINKNKFEMSYSIKDMYKIIDKEKIILSENNLTLYHTKKSALWHILQMLENDSDVEKGYNFLNNNEINTLEKWVKEKFNFVLEKIQIKFKK